MGEYGIGIDLGGTLIKAGLFDLGEGTLVERGDAPTRDGEREGGEPAFLSEIRRLIAGFEERAGGAAKAIGISAPGLANRGGSAIVCMPGRLHGLERLEWPAVLGREVRVLNDAHAALMGEIWRGAAAGRRDVILLTLGTGVGGAIVSDGKLLRGHTGKGGHIGHVTLDFMAPPDNCGMPGSLEDMIGNHNVSERTGGRFVSTRELVTAMEGGDAGAREAWDHAIRALGVAVASCVNVVDPELVLIGGGISAAWEHIRPGLQAHLEEFEWRPTGERVEIRRAELGEWAGTYGAVYNALQQQP